jgi:hypothetical protein
MATIRYGVEENWQEKGRSVAVARCDYDPGKRAATPLARSTPVRRTGQDVVDQRVDPCLTRKAAILKRRSTCLDQFVLLDTELVMDVIWP